MSIISNSSSYSNNIVAFWPGSTSPPYILIKYKKNQVLVQLKLRMNIETFYEQSPLINTSVFTLKIFNTLKKSFLLF